jgi:NADH-quinone oxidoreductase subunit H
LIVTLFFGGWTLPFGWFAGEEAAWWMLPLQGLVFLGKIACVIFFFIWVRWTVPRFRYDQLMKLGWCVFLELALVNIVVVGLILAFAGR